MKRTIIKNYDVDKIIIVPMGDEHIGSRFYDEDTHKRNVEWCYETKSPIILMGDELETATKDSPGAGVFEQSDILNEQVEKAVEIYRPLALENLIIGNHIGNHEMRVYNHSGINVSEMLSKLLGIEYLGPGISHRIKVGKNIYTLYTTHGASLSRLPHTKIKAVLDLANMIDVNIYAMGHLHALDHHARNFYKIVNNKLIEEQKHFILTGCYLSHWGSYAHVRGYEPSIKGSPKIKLSGEEKRIRISL